jgi:hypothetical protein
MIGAIPPYASHAYQPDWGLYHHTDAVAHGGQSQAVPVVQYRPTGYSTVDTMSTARRPDQALAPNRTIVPDRTAPMSFAAVQRQSAGILSTNQFVSQQSQTAPLVRQMHQFDETTKRVFDQQQAAQEEVTLSTFPGLSRWKV